MIKINFMENNGNLCRKQLHASLNIDLGAGNVMQIAPMKWLHVRGLSTFMKPYCAAQYYRETERMLISFDGIASLYPQKDQFIGIRLNGTPNGLVLSFGVSEMLVEAFKHMMESMFPGIYFEQEEDPELRLNFSSHSHVGLITGYPSYEIDSNDQPLERTFADILCDGMGDHPFIVQTIVCSYVYAVKQNLRAFVMNWQSEVERNKSSTFQVVDGASHNYTNYDAVVFGENLERVAAILDYADKTSLFRAQTLIAANNLKDYVALAGIAAASLNGKPDSVHESILIRHLTVEESGGLNAGEKQRLLFTNPCMIGQPSELNSKIFNADLFATQMSPRELAILFSLPRKEHPGCFMDEYVEFDTDVRPSRKVSNFLLGEIVRAGRGSARTNNKYRIPLDELTRHALIIGITGGGKTNTSKSILRSLWMDYRVPFLVIESAKREYWELCRLTDQSNQAIFKDLCVYTLGDENPRTGNPFRLNPMEAVPDISLQTHIDYLLSTFKAAFELYPPMPYVLEAAVYEVYDDFGWDIVDGTNRYRINTYPTLQDLYEKIDSVTERLGYYKEIESNVKAALKARIYSLMIGGKGAMLNTSVSIDCSGLLSMPTILELEDLGDDDTKAFVIGILLVRIYEYRKVQAVEATTREDGLRGLKHVILVEEAHRLLKNVTPGSEGDQSRNKAVEFFCNMLAEIRSYKQGIVISDQIPTKLAPDTLKNTNLKIVHRTVMKEDREAVGNAMNMRPEQMEHISSLPVGMAAVFSEGDNRPKLVQFPLVEEGLNIPRHLFIELCAKRSKGNLPAYDYSPMCRWCDAPCRYREQADQFVERCGGMAKLIQAQNEIVSQSSITRKDYTAEDGCVSAMLKQATERNIPLSKGMIICIFGNIMNDVESKLSPFKFLKLLMEGKFD